MNILLLAQKITTLHHDTIILWKTHGLLLNNTDFLRLVEENHSFNYQLWNAEDRARRDDLGSEFVHKAKREIDSHNQMRNDRMEMMDSWIWEHLKPSENGLCPVHTETPGMIIDRLSIISLKSYHMQLQTLRTDVDAEHIESCLNKLKIIKNQHKQLTEGLNNLLIDITNQNKTFKIYHQMKMYNNPKLNPELYSS